jgi:hypothetical protein
MMVNRYGRVGVIATILLYLYTSAVLSDSPLTCSVVEGGDGEEMDPGLEKMTFDIGSGTEVAWVSGYPMSAPFIEMRRDLRIEI